MSLRLPRVLLLVSTSGTAMADDTTKRGKPDRIRINVHETWEFDYWKDALDVSEQQLDAAVRKVGPMVKDVKKDLKDGARRPSFRLRGQSVYRLDHFADRAALLTAPARDRIASLKELHCPKTVARIICSRGEQGLLARRQL